MIDFGIVSLLVLQVFMVIGCIFAFFRMAAIKESILQAQNDNIYKIRALENDLALMKTNAETGLELPKNIKKSIDEIKLEMNDFNIELQNHDATIKSMTARIAARTRWAKKEAEEGEKEAEGTHEGEQPNVRQFGRRRTG